jgi:lariat debranching enzyme
MGLLRNLKPQWWFAAHLHVRFEATVMHDVPGQLRQQLDTARTSEAVSSTPPPQSSSAPPMKARNPDEIAIDLDDFEDDAPPGVMDVVPDLMVQEEHVSPPEVLVGESSSDLTADPPQTLSVHVSEAISRRSETKFLALDKCLPRRAYLEVRRRQLNSLIG